MLHLPRLLVALLAVPVSLGLTAPAWAGRPDPVASARTAPAPAAGHILMLDTATTPALSKVQAWQRSSPYKAIAVYIPEQARFDVRYDKVQTELDASWVHAVRAGGWQVLPIYVGLQAPCSTFSKKMSPDPGTARSQGIQMAADAAASVYRLGLPVGAPIAFDLEAYPTSNARCTAAVQAMLGGWTQRLHQLGRNSSVYGSVSSTIRDVLAASQVATYPKPDSIWVARWDGQPTTNTTEFAGGWAGRRMRQFAGGGNETYGGVTLNIDESAVQPGAFRLPPPDRTAPTLAVGAVHTTRASHTTLRWRMHDSSGIARYQVQIRTGGRWRTPKGFKKTKRTATRVAIRAGGRVCARARGTDRAGNTSAWQTTCTYRWNYGARFHGKKWKRSGNSLTMTRPTVATGPRVSGRRIGLQLRGGVPVEVRVGGHVIGTVRGNGVHWITMPSARSGRLQVRPLKRGRLVIASYIATP
ncbi:DUF1906 domain-containing protein [Nocardioides sp. Kera G14]|uniref:DUF1906 domain-containing protein n=1 Tax=Nocardioides sp. Kera G14 TaxID=2884264 RepID=UPI001D12E29E|nr:DUF1906 domain-containing protein [Nocardioides sp. Kera G14]UDY24442.1 DUF1906 domain-containing protein [Nocardioides sp. Kera G14]